MFRINLYLFIYLLRCFISVSYTHLDVYKRQELRYGDQHLCVVYSVQLKGRRQRSGESLQEFEANVDRLTRLAYPEESENFRKWISLIMFIDDIRDSQLQVLRIARNGNKSDALVHALINLINLIIH